MNNIISIVTPSFSQGKYIEQTIQSVLAQSGDFYIDYIIMDGGSTDTSIEVIQKYENKLKDNCDVIELNGLLFYVPRAGSDFYWNRSLGISYRWVSAPDGGQYAAIKAGLSKARGNILAWIGSDDIYHPGAFSMVNGIFRKYPQIQWLTGANSSINEAGECTHVRQQFNWSKSYLYIRTLLDGRHFIQQESTFWRSELWNKSGGLDTSLNYAGDFELWLKFSNLTKLYVCTALLGGFRFRTSNQKSLEGMDTYRQEAKAVLKNDFAKLTLRKKVNLVALVALHWVISRLVFVRNTPRIHQLADNLCQCPPRLLFDRHKQEFILERADA
jgi:glycosyltransferase involved in cell wall biosynthesis